MMMTMIILRLTFLLETNRVSILSSTARKVTEDMTLRLFDNRLSRPAGNSFTPVAFIYS
jgi:hypothetical protein